MAMSVRFEWHDEGFQSVISSPKVQSIVQAATSRIAATAGEGFEASQSFTKGLRYDRAVGIVSTVSDEARIAQATDRALSKAVQKCRV